MAHTHSPPGDALMPPDPDPQLWCLSAGSRRVTSNLFLAEGLKQILLLLSSCRSPLFS